MAENVVRIGIFQKPETLSVEEFRDYWHYHHAPIATNMVGMQRYDQNHCIKPVDLGLGAVNDRECYGMSKIWFGTMDNQKSNDPETMHKLAIDEKHLFKAMDLVVCEEKAYKNQDLTVPFIKYIALIKRDENIDEETFQAKWDATAEEMLKVPGVTGLVHNHVFERVYNDIQGEVRYEANYEQVPVDGVLELYVTFNEAHAEGDLFSSEQGKAVQALYQDIVGDISCWLDNTYRIL